MNTRFLNKLRTAAMGYPCSVFVNAYINLNVGDDLFLHKLVSTYPHVRFVMLARKPYGEMFSRYRNVTVYEEDAFLLRTCRKLRIDDAIRWRISHECDYSVYIGGSIFKEFPEWENQPQWYRELFDPERLYFLGCSWGPVKTRQFEKDMTDVLAVMKDVCFRDRYSYNTFAHLGNVRYAPDILFGLEQPSDIKEEKQVLISLVNCRRSNVELPGFAESYNRFICGLAEGFAELGYRTILCAFCEQEGDLAAAEEIHSLLSPNARAHASVVNYCGTNLEQLRELIARSEYVVATRFHAMILGLAAGKKVLPVIYHMKLQKALDDLSFRGAVCDIRKLPESPAALIGEITRGISEEERARLAALSAGHFDKLSSILNSPERTGKGKG